MQIERNLTLCTKGEQIKYIPVFEKETGIYAALFSKTADGTGITIAGDKCYSDFVELTIEKIASEQFGFHVGWQWSNFTSKHTIAGENPKIFTIIELISREQAEKCLRSQPEIVEILLGKSVYTPMNASGILKFFFATFAKKNSQVIKFTTMLKNVSY